MLRLCRKGLVHHDAVTATTASHAVHAMHAQAGRPSSAPGAGGAQLVGVVAVPPRDTF